MLRRLTRLRPRALVATLLAALVLVLVACGGGDTLDSKPTSDPTTAEAADPGEAVPARAALDRFHYVATLTLREQGDDPGTLTVTTEGDFQQPDRHDFTYVTERDGSELKQTVVIIGDEAWLRASGGDWRALDAADPEVAGLVEVAFSTARARFLGGPELVRLRDALRALPSTVETVNGVEANHYSVGGPGQEFVETFDAGDGLTQSVDDLAWDLWLAIDGGWPVRLQMSGTIGDGAATLDQLDLAAPVAWELSVDVSRPDDPTIQVLPPR